MRVHGLHELSAANARQFRNTVSAALAPELHQIDIDLSQTASVDSSGLGALLTVHRAANELNRNGGVGVRLLHPQPAVLQVFELTRMHHLFEIVSTAAE